LRPFPLPGGEQAIREPRRSALGLLHELFGEQVFSRTDLAPLGAFSPAELVSLKTMLLRGLNSPRTSSVGRLFDAVASLAGLRQQTRFEGQAAMDLEFSLEDPASQEAYRFELAPQPGTGQGQTELPANDSKSPLVTTGAAALREPTLPPTPLVINWATVVQSMLSDIENEVTPAQLSAKFHNALAEVIVDVARRFDLERVVLSGGCFQNRYLTERTVWRLREEGFRPYWHQRVPPNDGGIALGQIAATIRSGRSADIPVRSDLG
jgi:hydrogenase maturation protein HypF